MSDPYESIARISTAPILCNLVEDDEVQGIEGRDRSIGSSFVARGETLYLPDKTGQALFLVKKGSVHLLRVMPEGRVLNVGTVGPMSCFGHMPDLGWYMNDLYAAAAEDCLVYVMDRAEAERLILSKPQIALRMREEIGHRIQCARERVCGLNDDSRAALQPSHNERFG